MRYVKTAEAQWSSKRVGTGDSWRAVTIPNVRQRVHVVTDIEDKYSSILVRATIKYPYKTDDNVVHSAENSIKLAS